MLTYGNRTAHIRETSNPRRPLGFVRHAFHVTERLGCGLTNKWYYIFLSFFLGIYCSHYFKQLPYLCDVPCTQTLSCFSVHSFRKHQRPRESEREVRQRVLSARVCGQAICDELQYNYQRSREKKFLIADYDNLNSPLTRTFFLFHLSSSSPVFDFAFFAVVKN